MTVGHYESNLDGAGVRVGIVKAPCFNNIGAGLLDACLAELKRLGVMDEDVLHVTVPGAGSTTGITQNGCDHQFDALIALGAVIRIETYHLQIGFKWSGSGITRVELTGIQYQTQFDH